MVRERMRRVAPHGYATTFGQWDHPWVLEQLKSPASYYYLSIPSQSCYCVPIICYCALPPAAENSGRPLLLGLWPLPTKSVAGAGCHVQCDLWHCKSALVDLGHSAAKAHHGSNEQMFGAESQDPHGAKRLIKMRAYLRPYHAREIQNEDFKTDLDRGSVYRSRGDGSSGRRFGRHTEYS